MGERIYFEVRSGKGRLTGQGGFTDVICWAERIPVLCRGWRFVRWNGRRYLLHGGIRTNYFICTNNPIPRRFTWPGN